MATVALGLTLAARRVRAALAAPPPQILLLVPVVAVEVSVVQIIPCRRANDRLVAGRISATTGGPQAPPSGLPHRPARRACSSGWG
jgi:hypothetical protein